MSLRRLPAKRWIKGKPRKMKRFFGRVRGIISGSYFVTLWPCNRQPLPEIVTNLSKQTKGMTVVGKLVRGTPIELWTWEELYRGKSRQRLHIKRLPS